VKKLVKIEGLAVYYEIVKKDFYTVEKGSFSNYFI